jgi:hypothetical protein
MCACVCLCVWVALVLSQDWGVILGLNGASRRTCHNLILSCKVNSSTVKGNCKMEPVNRLHENLLHDSEREQQYDQMEKGLDTSGVQESDVSAGASSLTAFQGFTKRKLLKTHSRIGQLHYPRKKSPNQKKKRALELDTDDESNANTACWDMPVPLNVKRCGAVAVVLYVTSLTLFPSQWAFCSHPYHMLEVIFLGLIMVNTLYASVFSYRKHELLQNIPLPKDVGGMWRLSLTTFVVFFVIGASLGQTKNCRDPVLRGVFRFFMAVIVLFTSALEYQNIKRKSQLFRFVFYKRSIADLKVPNEANVVVDIENRIQAIENYLAKLYVLITGHLVLDLLCLTVFYLTILIYRDQFIQSFSLSVTIIILFCVNMSSNIFNMVEFNKNIKYCELKARRELPYEVGIFGWKPEGDLLIGYLFALIYIGVEVCFHKFDIH